MIHKENCNDEGLEFLTLLKVKQSELQRFVCKRIISKKHHS